MNRLLTVFLLLTANLALGDTSGLQIATKAYNVEDGNDFTATIQMDIQKGGKVVKSRTLELQRADEGDKKDRAIFRVCSPRLLKGTTFLTWNNPDENSNLWLYLPSRKKSRKISSGSKYKKFVSSNFTYDDLSKWSLTQNSFKFLRDEKVNGVDCFVIQSIPKKITGKTTKKIAWIRKDNFLIHKVDYYNKDNAIFKQLQNTEIKKIDNIWTITKSSIVDIKTGNSTTLTIKEINYNSDIKLDLFSPNRLRQKCKN